MVDLLILAGVALAVCGVAVFAGPLYGLAAAAAAAVGYGFGRIRGGAGSR